MGVLVCKLSHCRTAAVQRTKGLHGGGVIELCREYNWFCVTILLGVFEHLVPRSRNLIWVYDFLISRFVMGIYRYRTLGEELPSKPRVYNDYCDDPFPFVRSNLPTNMKPAMTVVKPTDKSDKKVVVGQNKYTVSSSQC